MSVYCENSMRLEFVKASHTGPDTQYVPNKFPLTRCLTLFLNPENQELSDWEPLSVISINTSGTCLYSSEIKPTNGVMQSVILSLKYPDIPSLKVIE